MKQNFDLQNALMSIRSPEAYRDIQRDMVPIDPKNEEILEKQRVYANMLPKALKAIESPIFESVDDMIAALGGVITRDEGIKSESLHQNSES